MGKERTARTLLRLTRGLARALELVAQRLHALARARAARGPRSHLRLERARARLVLLEQLLYVAQALLARRVGVRRLERGGLERKARLQCVRQPANGRTRKKDK
jgi:hypothetical protein